MDRKEGESREDIRDAESDKVDRNLSIEFGAEIFLER